MARLAVIAAESGHASGREESAANPLCLISRRLYVPRAHDPHLMIERWRLPTDPRDHGSAAQFEALLRSRRAFIVGGLQLVIELGLLPTWYRDDNRRAEALALIDERNWRPILQRLADRESDNGIFGKSEIPKFFSTFPPVRRADAGTPRIRRDDDAAPFRIWNEHRLRLRKAIEFIALTEAILRWRFSISESVGRFKDLTGHFPEDNDGLYVLDHLWIEPIIYVIEPLPREADIPRIMGNHAIVSAFRLACGQPAGALYWALRSVPCKLPTAEAAAAACNAFYGNGAAECAVVTVKPEEYMQRVALTGKRNHLPAYAREIEHLPQLGPARAF
jgi:hypothetical protein